MEGVLGRRNNLRIRAKRLQGGVGEKVGVWHWMVDRRMTLDTKERKRGAED